MRVTANCLLLLTEADGHAQGSRGAADAPPAQDIRQIATINHAVAIDVGVADADHRAQFGSIREIHDAVEIHVAEDTSVVEQAVSTARAADRTADVVEPRAVGVAAELAIGQNRIASIVEDPAAIAASRVEDELAVAQGRAAGGLVVHPAAVVVSSRVGQERTVGQIRITDMVVVHPPAVLVGRVVREGAVGQGRAAGFVVHPTAKQSCCV